MSDCRKCGKRDAEYPFRVLEVQTLHIRDMARENRVQALGLFQDADICRDCAQKQLNSITNPKKTLLRKLLPFICILLFGAAVLAFSWGGARAFIVLGIAGILCGIMGIASGIKGAVGKRKEYSAMDPEEALSQAAWESLLTALPKKIGDNDMTYIPINEKTMKMKNGDLMIVYELLPDIAKKAWDLIHGRE